MIRLVPWVQMLAVMALLYVPILQLQAAIQTLAGVIR